MFCPNCGNNVPDDASFCGKCGNKFAERAAPQPANAGSIPANIGNAVSVPLPQSIPVGSAVPAVAGGLSVLQIVTVIVAIVALIFSFMPWYYPSTTVKNIGTVGNALGEVGSALSGQKNNFATFKDSYAVTDFVGLGKDLSAYVSAKRDIDSAASSLSSQYDSSGRRRAQVVSIVDPQYVSTADALPYLMGYFFYGWIVALILLIAGAALMLTKVKHYKVLLILGAIVMACVTFVWYFASLELVNSNYAAQPGTNALISGILCIAVIVLAAITKRNTTSSPIAS